MQPAGESLCAHSDYLNRSFLERSTAAAHGDSPGIKPRAEKRGNGRTFPSSCASMSGSMRSVRA